MDPFQGSDMPGDALLYIHHTRTIVPSAKANVSPRIRLAKEFSVYICKKTLLHNQALLQIATPGAADE